MITSHDTPRSSRSAFVLITALLLLGAAAAAAQSVEVASFNTTYEGTATDLEPIRQGPITIHVSSPSYRLTMHRNRFAFTPAGGGVLDATVECELEGTGQLVAVVETAGSRNDFDDRLEVPRQTLTLAGKLRLERIETGFRFTVVEAPATLGITIRSAALTRILGACDALSQIPFLALSCKGLEQALSTARVPVPKAGESFVLADSSLSLAERAFFARFAHP